MQRYRRKWHKAVPGLDNFARRLQIPENIRLKILGGFQAHHIRSCIYPKYRKAGKQDSRTQAAITRSVCLYIDAGSLFTDSSPT